MGTMRVLVVNCGSSSVKYDVLDPDTGAVTTHGSIERIGDEKTYPQAIGELLDAVQDETIDAVGHRVVHGGSHFHNAVEIDDEVIDAIQSCVPLAPLHNPANLAGIHATRAALPDVMHVAVFDTAFHARMPRRARTYAIDSAVSAAYGIRRFGFHGPSHSYVAGLAAEFLDTPIEQLRLVTLHLGNGASACAVEHGHSVDTSMGLTPLEGLVMGTRSGDIDPGIVLYLARTIGIDDTDTLLNRQSGLSGLSGKGNDLRDITWAAAEGDDNARLAINVFAHRIRKYIGAYAAIMGGLDAVVLTGGIGENSVDMRRRILQRMGFLGIQLDDRANDDAMVDDATSVADIAASTSRVRVLVARTNEALQIARSTAKLAGAASKVDGTTPIPIAVSARHVHLTRDAVDALFGEGHELTPYKELSQPGQFAAEERVTLIGPRGRIERVRVLGPLRPACQVEVSRTDEFKLGVDAPVRRSGHVEHSAPITLEGPAGKLDLAEGLICAWRHIHMTTADAEAYGVKQGDEVEVAIMGGPRDLIFGDVLVRVKDSYKLEMHIDTDEANAAELGRTSEGDLVYTDVYVESRTAHAELRSKR